MRELFASSYRTESGSDRIKDSTMSELFTSSYRTGSGRDRIMDSNYD